MNLINCTPLFRLSIRVFTIAVLMLLLVGCVQPQITPTIAPTVTDLPVPSPSATRIPPTQTPSSPPTATNSPSPTSSPTITLTPEPTWTSWFVGMNYPPSERLALDPKNPQQNCFISYFDLTLEPGFIGVWRRDNGNYLICAKKAENQP